MFKQLFKVLDYFSNTALILSIAGFSILAFTQVICRYALNSSLSWSEQACRYLFCVTTFLGAAVCVRERSHITIDILAECLPKRYLKYQSLVISLMIFVFTLLLIATGWQLAYKNLNQDTTTLPIKMGTIYMMIPISAAIMAINALRVAVADIQMIIKGEDEEKKAV